MAHYREALRLSGVKGRGEVATLIKKDFPNGGLSDCLKELSGLPLNEIGLFFFYLGCLRVADEDTSQFRYLSQIHTRYSERFHINAPLTGIISRRRYYRLIETKFAPLSERMKTTKESSEWRVYLDMCMGKEQMAA